MVSKSERSEKIRDHVRSRLESARTSHVNQIESREASSDRFRGVELRIYGSNVPIRPIVEFVGQQDSIGIEEFYHCTEMDEPNLIVFIAYLPEQPHPAFV